MSVRYSVTTGGGAYWTGRQVPVHFLLLLGPRQTTRHCRRARLSAASDIIIVSCQAKPHSGWCRLLADIVGRQIHAKIHMRRSTGPERVHSPPPQSGGWGAPCTLGPQLSLQWIVTKNCIFGIVEKMQGINTSGPVFEFLRIFSTRLWLV